MKALSFYRLGAACLLSLSFSLYGLEESSDLKQLGAIDQSDKAVQLLFAPEQVTVLQTKQSHGTFHLKTFKVSSQERDREWFVKISVEKQTWHADRDISFINDVKGKKQLFLQQHNLEIVLPVAQAAYTDALSGAKRLVRAYPFVEGFTMAQLFDRYKQSGHGAECLEHTTDVRVCLELVSAFRALGKAIAILAYGPVNRGKVEGKASLCRRFLYIRLADRHLGNQIYDPNTDYMWLIDVDYDEDSARKTATIDELVSYTLSFIPRGYDLCDSQCKIFLYTAFRKGFIDYLTPGFKKSTTKKFLNLTYLSILKKDCYFLRKVICDFTLPED